MDSSFVLRVWTKLDKKESWEKAETRRNVDEKEERKIEEEIVERCVCFLPSDSHLNPAADFASNDARTGCWWEDQGEAVRPQAVIGAVDTLSLFLPGRSYFPPLFFFHFSP